MGSVSSLENLQASSKIGYQSNSQILKHSNLVGGWSFVLRMPCVPFTPSPTPRCTLCVGIVESLLRWCYGADVSSKFGEGGVRARWEPKPAIAHRLARSTTSQIQPCPSWIRWSIISIVKICLAAVAGFRARRAVATAI